MAPQGSFGWPDQILCQEGLQACQTLVVRVGAVLGLLLRLQAIRMESGSTLSSLMAITDHLGICSS